MELWAPRPVQGVPGPGVSVQLRALRQDRVSVWQLLQSGQAGDRARELALGGEWSEVGRAQAARVSLYTGAHHPRGVLQFLLLLQPQDEALHLR